MINKELLEGELQRYKERGTPLTLVKYNRDFIFNLFKKYKNYGMTENSYCCYGEERCCWQEVVEEGIWGLTLKSVRADILYNFKNLKNELRSIKKYGHRMYMFQDKNRCCIYIYMRDLIQCDLHIWFSN